MVTNISMAELQSLFCSKPTVDIVWRESEDSKIESYKMLNESISLALTQAMSRFCINAVHNTDLGPNQHLKHPIIITGRNMHSCSLVFQWICAHALGASLLEDYEFDIAPLYQAHRLFETADYLGVDAMKPFIVQKIKQIKSRPFRFSDTIPILLTNAPNTTLYKHIVEGVSNMIIIGTILESDKNLMVMRAHYPAFAVELDETVDNKRLGMR